MALSVYFRFMSLTVHLVFFVPGYSNPFKFAVVLDEQYKERISDLANILDSTTGHICLLKQRSENGFIWH